MTKKTVINCNHCHAAIADDTQGIGIYFVGPDNAKAVGVNNAEAHLCTACARGYQAAISQILGKPVPASISTLAR